MDIPEKYTDMVVVFLAPKQYEGKLGIQRMDENLEVVALLLDDGTDMSHVGCSYRGLNNVEFSG